MCQPIRGVPTQRHSKAKTQYATTTCKWETENPRWAVAVMLMLMFRLHMSVLLVC